MLKNQTKNVRYINPLHMHKDLFKSNHIFVFFIVKVWIFLRENSILKNYFFFTHEVKNIEKNCITHARYYIYYAFSRKFMKAYTKSIVLCIKIVLIQLNCTDTH
ncbi:hypothetical protein EDEG_02376 [Edhazardia aedis USNM 41457]|uniref:Uncharacterized protein n=1 Tax=Edhazardia aedis (strain USNM 41457) TaxID=1003232 RepID=J9DPI9_EDHAE|nr:hypothetical protein EDEG_02376 [Edhazardia aedis USNM 41457]|eukprot:EJW03267.1 hypothetical protein EDEG_02376 [Edhazardia aedis USNM 41457]